MSSDARSTTETGRSVDARQLAPRPSGIGIGISTLEALACGCPVLEVYRQAALAHATAKREARS